MLTEPVTATGMNTILIILSSMHDNCESEQSLLYQYDKLPGLDMRISENWNQYLGVIRCLIYIQKYYNLFNIQFPYSYNI
jgi:hypothetical protein